VRFAWSAADARGTIAGVQLQRRTGAGRWVTVVSRGPSNGAVTRVSAGRRHRFRVRATDLAGNTGVSEPLTTAVVLRESTSGRIAWSGAWRTRPSATASGRSLRTSTMRDATARLDFAGRSVAWVASLGPGYGRALVLIDGKPVARVDLRTSGPRGRRIVFASADLGPGRHRIVIRVLSGLVDVDAFLVLR
jgi:hypothetical protein